MADPGAFDHYEILKHADGSLHELGRGAMGITYKAFDKNLRVPVALKVINAATLQSELARQRFVREARAAAQLRHPNVASVFHLGSTGDSYFYSMEFIEGETVGDLIRRTGPVPPRLALQITVQVARALAAAEKQKLVHRDIKPANLMILSGEEELTVKVIDFGLAKSCKENDNEDLVTLSMGGFIGTPQFASPEQLEERDLDIRSDIYSLGITLWFMLAGKAPFAGSLAQVMSQHLSKPPPFDDLPGLPPPVRPLLARMLEKNPDNRFQTATELRLETEKTIGLLDTCGRAGAASAVSGAAPVFSDDCPTVVADGVAGPPSPQTGSPSVAIQTKPVGTSPAASPVPAGRKSPVALIAGIAAFVLLAGGATYFMMNRHGKTAPVPAASTPAPSPQAAASPPVSAPSPVLTPVPTPAPSGSPQQPAVSPVQSMAQATPAPAPTVAVPTPTPVPTPSQNDLLRARIATAEAFETSKNWPACIGAYAAISKDFPESDLGKVRLELVLTSQRTVLEKISGDEFEALRGPLETAAKLGVISAEMLLAGHLRRSEPGVAFNWFYDAASRGYAPAMTQVGLMYSNGAGAELDMAKAANWFQQADTAGDPAGKTCLAECYLAGRGTARDEQKAVNLLKDAVAAGDLRAMDHLGTCFQKGTGTTKNFEEAARLFKLASDKGYPDSLGNLGVLYINGEGVEKDLRKSIELFKQGADQGSSVCMFLLAKCYETGVGTDVNKLQAASWYSKSAELGNPNAADWCRKNGVTPAAKNVR